MTTTQTHSRPSLLTTSTTVILAVLGLIDIALVGAIWTADPPPLAVSLGVGALPAFFLDAPAWVMVVEGFVIVATVCALVMVRRSVTRPA